MNRQRILRTVVPALIFSSIVAVAWPADAQERWNPDLMICGTASDGVWQGTGSNCIGQLGADSTNAPNDFAEVIDPVSHAHHLLVADTVNGRVLRFLDTGSAVTYVGVLALPPGGHVPFGVVGDQDGNILVADYQTSSVYRFDWSGASIGTPITSCAGDPFPGGFSSPYRIALAPGTSVSSGNPSGTVFIVDTGNNRVVMCDGSMNFIGHFGNDPTNTDPEAVPGFSAPTAVAIDAVNNLLYVASPNFPHPRVHVFAWDASLGLGTPPLWTISNEAPGVNRTSVQDMVYPFGVAVDANQRLLVADAGANKMFVFDSYAKLPHLNPVNVRIGTSSQVTEDYPDWPPPPPGMAGDLAVPANITLDSTGRLMIADAYGMRVQRFSHPVMTATVTPPAHAPQVGQPFTLDVAVQTASGAFDSIQLEYLPHDSALGTAALQPAVPGHDTVIAGNGATDFTLTFTPTAGGTFAFQVWATGIPSGGGARVGGPDGAGATEPIVVGATGDLPVTTAIITSASPAVPVTSGCTNIGCPPIGVTSWYVTQPFVHVEATGTPAPTEIDYVIQIDKPIVTTIYTACPPATSPAGNLSCDVPVTADGLSHVWYRAKSTSTGASPVTFTEDWKDQPVNYDAQPPRVLDDGTSPVPRNGWNNSTFNAIYRLLPGAVGWPAHLQTGASLVPNGSQVTVTVPTQPDSSSFFVTVPEYKDAAGRSSQEIRNASGAWVLGPPVQLGPFKLDSHAPTTTAPLFTPPAGVVLNGNQVYDLTGLPADAGVKISVTAADASPSSTFQVFSATGAGNPTCLPVGPACLATTFDSATGTYSATLLNTVPNGSIWALDLATNVSTIRSFSITITRNTPSGNAASISTLQNQAVTGTLTSTPAPGTTPTVSYALSTPAAHGTVTLTNAATGAFTYTPALNYAGPDSFRFTVSDGIGISSAATISVTVTAINHAPSFTAGVSQSVDEDAGAVTVANWATNISAGLSNESGQLLNFIVTNSNNTLFAVQPAVAANGTLTYTTAANANGAVTVTVALHDNGGTANGGVDTSATQTFTITLRPVNDAPVASNGTLLATEDTAQTGTLVATDVDNASLTYSIVANGTKGVATITNAATGAYTYTPNANADGTDTFTFKASDGLLTSNTATVSVTITSVNDAPTFTLAATAISIPKNAGPQTTAGFATGISAGPNEASQTALFLVTTSNAGLFAAPPAIAPTGTLTFTPQTAASGTATVTVTLQDNGGTLNGGIDRTTRTFTITVSADTNRLPVCTAATASQTSLWPPNHKLVAIGITGVTDPDGDAVTIAVNKIWQDESTMADGSGDTPIDAAIVAGAAQVRAERAGTGNGRVYQIFFTATDAKNASCTGSVTVGVPHDQSGGPVVDSGVRYDSLVVNGPMLPR